MTKIKVKDYMWYIRHWFTGNEGRTSCYVCGKYKPITEKHHCIPVSTMAHMCAEAGVNLDQLKQLPVYVVWLCPTHHAIHHALQRHRKGKEKQDKANRIKIFACMEKEERDRIIQVLEMEHWDELDAFLAKVKEENERGNDGNS